MPDKVDSEQPATSPPGRSRRRTIALSALAIAIPLVPVVVGVALASDHFGGTSTATIAAPAPVRKVVVRPLHRSVPGGYGALVALVRHPTPMRTAPGGRIFARLGTKTGFGSPSVVLVAKYQTGWLGVVSPIAGNGRLGWIRKSATHLSRVPWEIKVSLSARKVTVLDHGRIVHRYTVAIGAPYAPTPTGRFAVTDLLRTGDPTGPYGCCIVALSAESPHAIQGWDGGNRIAIHSTPDTSSIGLPVSHGCMRLTLPEGQWLLAHIPLGTPTVINTT